METKIPTSALPLMWSSSDELDVSNSTPTQKSNNNAGTDIMVDIVIYVIIGVFGMLGNAFAAFIIKTSRSMMKTNTNILILNQCLIDFCCSVCVVAQSTIVYDQAGYYGTIGLVRCLLWSSKVIQWSFFVSSTANLVVLTLEKYLQVKYPILHRISFTKTKLGLLIGFVWLSGFLINFPIVIPTSYIDPNTHKCLNMQLWPSETVRRVIGVLAVILEFIVPLVIIVFCYLQIFRVLRGRVHPARRASTIDDKNYPVPGRKEPKSGTGSTIEDENSLAPGRKVKQAGTASVIEDQDVLASSRTVQPAEAIATTAKDDQNGHASRGMVHQAETACTIEDQSGLTLSDRIQPAGAASRGKVQQAGTACIIDNRNGLTLGGRVQPARTASTIEEQNGPSLSGKVQLAGTASKIEDQNDHTSRKGVQQVRTATDDQNDPSLIGRLQPPGTAFLIDNQHSHVFRGRLQPVEPASTRKDQKGTVSTIKDQNETYSTIEDKHGPTLSGKVKAAETPSTAEDQNETASRAEVSPDVIPNNLRSRRRQDMWTKARHNVVKTLLTSSICFLICWVWNQLFFLLFNLGQPVDYNSSYYHFTVYMVFLNFCTNPIVYTVRYKQFQQSIKSKFLRRSSKGAGQQSHVFPSSKA